jgi:hypothetical protein
MEIFHPDTFFIAISLISGKQLAIQIFQRESSTPQLQKKQTIVRFEK